MKRLFLLFLLLAISSVISIEIGYRELGIILALISAAPAGISFEIATRHAEAN